ncbi:MAG: LamG domain-containing protein [Sedimentisphaerales bacterium]|nr:LamG domain-containing protein [Sedimentisphaerales bacterium]
MQKQSLYITKLALAGLFLITVAGLDNFVHSAVPQPALVAPAGTWQLDLTLHGNPQKISIKLPGAEKTKSFWYLLYSVTNNTAREVDFYPRFELFTNTFRLSYAGESVRRPVFEAIRELYADTLPLLEPEYLVSGRILVGQDNTRDSVAIFEDFDYGATATTIFVSGLSNETVNVKYDSLVESDTETSQALVAHWGFDQSQGSSALDSVGGNNGDLNEQPLWRAGLGKIGGALEFNGSSDCVSVANEAVFDLRDQIAVAAWVKVRAFDTDGVIIAKGSDGWGLRCDSANRTFRFACGAGPEMSVAGTGSVGVDQWHHVVGVYDGQEIRLYVDGFLNNSREASGEIGTNDIGVCIGGDQQMSGCSFNGMIDDVRIYNRGLNLAEVRSVMDYAMPAEVLLRKTLALKYQVPGDAFNPEQRVMLYRDREWIMR